MPDTPPEPVPTDALPPASGGPVKDGGGEIILWHVPLSRSMRILWLLNELELPFSLRVMDLRGKDMRAAEYAAIHPVGRAPALQIDGNVIHESGAMVEYLCETRGPHLWRAPGAEGRLGWLDWLHFAETIGQHIANLTQSHLMLRDPSTRSHTVMKLETARLARTLRLVEQTVEGQDWLMAGDFSGVDCAVGWSVWTAGRFVRLSPALQAYADRCTARPAFGRALPQEGEPQLYDRDFYELSNA
ncbi:glutathione S-transferase family protein [Paracoccus benzoatiresistens]|uniref:Glutathione S-transferase n=1 Tax=Paracoccus benzoatiresistens TaxID=2997341 RepID=A0ABT4J688_9RHOB|nr:glutathione S-transferase [Paracoccus sp. EF6]MCZ0962581.1 glutathione S-transferase [Paracoccus sp. EF6]